MTTCLRSSCTSFSHKKQKKAKSNANGIAAPATKCSHLLSVVMHPRIACVMAIFRQLLQPCPTRRTMHETFTVWNPAYDFVRSEERRVGKEGRSTWSPY